MKKRKFSKKSSPEEPTPRGLPTLDELDELMKGVDLWEMDKPPEVVAEGRKKRRPWLNYPTLPSSNIKLKKSWYVIKFLRHYKWEIIATLCISAMITYVYVSKL
jgi:hypothetical protein